MIEAIEVSTVALVWRKSSRSTQDGSNGNCVEVAYDGPAVALRDSKSPDRGNLVLPLSGWTSFLRVSKRWPAPLVAITAPFVDRSSCDEAVDPRVIHAALTPS